MPGTSTPGTVRDFPCDTFEEALAELHRRKSAADGVITRLEESPYGGYRVYSTPVELLVDDLIDPIQPQVPGGGLSSRKAIYQ